MFFTGNRLNRQVSEISCIVSFNSIYLSQSPIYEQPRRFRSLHYSAYSTVVVVVVVVDVVVGVVDVVVGVVVVVVVVVVSILLLPRKGML